jgi:hypothetical protein
MNGSGSANNLPHGLYFGAWELRAFSFVVLPLATWAWTGFLDGYAAIYTKGWVYGWGQFSFAMYGAVVVLALLFLSFRVWRQVISWFASEQVVRTKLPGGDHIIFVDRTCSQLRAMPIKPGRSRLMGEWPATPSWCYSPPVSTIKEIEHTAPPTNPGGQWWPCFDVLWPSGPWCASCGTVCGDPHNIDDELEGLRSAAGIRSYTVSFDGLNEALVQQDNQNPMLVAHPIRVKTQFTFAALNRNSVAGVLSIPWVDGAILAGPGLRGLEKMLGGKASFRSNVAQLSGPLTSGRLAACFDWGIEWPLLWPVSVFVKVLVGAYIAAAPKISDNTSIVDVLVHVLVAGALASMAFLVFVVKPYTHAVDNLGLSAAFSAATLGVLVQHFGDVNPSLAARGAIFLGGVLSVPLLTALFAALISNLFAVRWSRLDLHDRVLPRVIRGWGSPGVESHDSTRKSFALLEQRDMGSDSWLWEDDCQDSTNQGAESATAASTPAVDVVLTLLGAPVPVVSIPAQVTPRVIQTRVSSVLSATGSIAYLPDDGARVRLPLPTSLFFSAVATRADGPRQGEDGRSVEQTIPLAALLTPDGGRLIYADPTLNNGAEWRQAVHRYFGPNDKQLAIEVEKVIQGDAPEGTPRACREEERSFAIVEVVNPLRDPHRSPR